VVGIRRREGGGRIVVGRGGKDRRIPWQAKSRTSVKGEEG
jgi:hypothetical protein